MDIATGVDIQQLVRRQAEVRRLVFWWVSQNNAYRRVVKNHDTTRDFYQSVWVRLLRNFPPGHRVDFTLSTVVITTCKWELGSYHTRDNVARHRLHRKIRRGRCVRADDRVTDEDAHAVCLSREFYACVRQVLRRLHHRERTVLVHRLGLLHQPLLSSPELGKLFGCSRTFIGHLEDRAVRRLRRSTAAEPLVPYVPEPRPS